MSDEDAPIGDSEPEGENRRPAPRRRLRAVLAADVAGFSGRVSVQETHAFSSLSSMRLIAEEALNAHDGWLFGMPGDGVFAIFESAIDALRCALTIQERMERDPAVAEMQLRIGVHAGEVLFENGVPFGETLTVAARLEELAKPGRILTSSSVFEVASGRVEAVFSSRGVPRLKNVPRRIHCYDVDRIAAASARPSAAEATGADALDQTMRLDRPLARRLPGDTLDEVTAALTNALGPIANLVVDRQLSRARDLTDLLDRLEQKIDNANARMKFRARVAPLRNANGRSDVA